MNVKEVGAVWRFLESGDPGALAEYVEQGGAFSNRSARVIVEALQSKPRKHQNWPRDQRIIMAMQYHKLSRAVNSEADSMEKARCAIARRFNVSDATVKRIWEASQKG